MTARCIRQAVFLVSFFALAGGALWPALADTGASQPAARNPDVWPRSIQLSNASVLLYQPQVNQWNGNQLDFRAAVAIKPQGAETETYGSIFATARTLVDHNARTVTLENLKITKNNFPLLPDQGAAYIAELQAQHSADIRTISLDRLQASLAAAGIKPPAVPVKNDPPRIYISYSPAILVPTEGAPVIKPVPEDSRFQRVINTHALILQGGLEKHFYLHVYDGWLESKSLSGAWNRSSSLPFGMEKVAQQIEKTGVVDLLDGGPNANPKPSLANGIPIIFTSQGAAELIVFSGQPDFAPLEGTQLLRANNSRTHVFVDTANSRYYVLLAGRWFTSTSLNGPWAFVASDALPADFARIPPSSPAGVALQSVANTPQAQEAAIANSIPQTATIPRTNGPKFTPTFDGVPQFAPIPGTPLSQVVNSSTPLIKVDAHTFYAVSAGVWFTATTLEGPWVVASSVPQVIYTIPPSSPLYYVTFVRIYEATPEVVYVGYTPGYMGTVVEPSGTVVYGTGYSYDPWIGSVYYPAPVTYTVAAAPVYDAADGATFGFAMGMLAASSCCYGGEAVVYNNGYYGHGTATANTYGQYGNTSYSGTRSYSADGNTVSTKANGSYDNKATGTTGNYNAQRSYNSSTGVASQSYDRTANTAAGGTGNASRSETYNTNTGQYNTHSNVTAKTADGSTIDHTGSSTEGPQGDSHSGETTVDNAKTGQTKTYGSGTNDHYADSSGNVYKNSDSGWQQHSSSGWGGASGDTSSMDKESQARDSGESRYNSSSSDSSHSWGGDSGSSDRSSGGGGRSWSGGGGGGGARSFGGRR